MADKHEHGSMSIEAQEKTFAGFIKLAVWAVVITLAILILLALFAR